MNFQRIGAAACLCVWAASGFTYEVSTHREFSRVALLRSTVYRNEFMSRLGIPSRSSGKYPSFRFGGYEDGFQRSIIDLVQYGAQYEDEYDVSQSLDWVPNHSVARYHFFDPQWKNGAGRGITDLGGNDTSPNWITESKKTFSDQYFSFQDAQDAFHLALTSTDPYDRNSNFGFVFQSLGHIIHHIQDMAQPQHTRNEGHLHGEPIPQVFWDMPSAAYELHAEKYLNPRISMIAASKDYPVPVFNGVWDFWASSAVGRYVGMAEFSANNFVRLKSGYSSTPGVGGVPIIKNEKPEFPLPNGTNFDFSAKSVKELACKYTSLEDHKEYVETMNVVVGKIYDGYTNASTPERILASDKALAFARVDGYKVYASMHPCIWEADYDILVPRAVAFSTGLIEHFFRGKLEFARKNGTTWNLTNQSAYQMKGTYTVLSEDRDGRRSQVRNFPLDLAAHASAPVTFAEPAGTTTKMVVAFKGTIGAETGRVAGVVVPYTVEGAPCGTSISENKQGSEPYSNKMDLGTTAGKVSWEFEAYEIKDALTIQERVTGATRASTGGQVSGSHSGSWEYDGSQEQRIVDISVVPNTNPNTAWTLSVSCPGKALPAISGTTGERPSTLAH